MPKAPTYEQLWHWVSKELSCSNCKNYMNCIVNHKLYNNCRFGSEAWRPFWEFDIQEIQKEIDAEQKRKEADNGG